MPTSPITLDSPIPPHLDLAGAPSQLFQVPPSPSASSALYRSIAVPRKRARLQLDQRSSWLQVDGTSSPLVPSLTGPDDLPHGVDGIVDFDYRPSRYPPPQPFPLDTSVDSLSEAGGCRKRSRRDPSLIAVSPTGSDEKTISPNVPSHPSAAPVRWSKAVLGVVGKVWDFCWSGAFRGFYAGGGRGYNLSGEEDAALTFSAPASEKETMAVTPTAPALQRGPSTPLPGGFPAEDDLQRSWVMVPSVNPSPASSHSTHRSSTRRVPRRTTTAYHASRRGRSHHQRGLMSHAGSLPRQPFFSSPALPRESPVSVDTQRHMADVCRIEREGDESMRRMGKMGIKLQALIREGRQALGTQVEVSDLVMDDCAN
ncbi:uncharacterized protein BP01DRAFT_357909 [Aspergillus saccharolyticus JOP 1030-1]|uniref:Uncharacterized protein n=1 Tax=Aspergillus saccharolyticus JOP 1030-1 TaxID=1450539 RepID=A0A318ZDA4_9EURO|nr:hypothetical protein BP01DRAFT_357909 [Aspergillus saccharolyticus JOP 1030-1]PYH44284.1 hypothetical protein BP01DRAFT_357909 [Aspergillus saccharolyticus JOP 1030-1]